MYFELELELVEYNLPSFHKCVSKKEFMLLAHFFLCVLVGSVQGFTKNCVGHHKNFTKELPCIWQQMIKFWERENNCSVMGNKWLGIG